MHSKAPLVLAVTCAAAVSLGSAGRTSAAPHTERIAPNDNQRRAGRLENGVLTVSLEARNGEWRPEEDGGPTYTLSAFAEAGAPLQIPGPLLRAPVGTEIRVSVHNALDVPMWVYGLGERRGYPDSVRLAAGETREMRFRAATPGLSYYAGRTSSAPAAGRHGEDSQLDGAIVIDPPGATPRDRIFVISGWDSLDSTTVSGLGPNAILAFNGLGWPHTPRIDVEQGDTLHWRFVNVTGFEHPLHLHGAYFRVDAKGDDQLDTT